MDEREWLDNVFELIVECNNENKERMLIKFAEIAAKLGYELNF